MENADDNDMMHELGVTFKNDLTESGPKVKAKRFNAKLRIYREFTLATLSTILHERTQTSPPDDHFQFSTLDAYSLTGVAALQWKTRLKDAIHVTAADHDNISLLCHNAEVNSLQHHPWVPDVSRVPGDPREHQGGNEILTCSADARPLMTMESFNFIFLSPHKSDSTCLGPAFHSLPQGGVLCLVVPDLSCFARTPHVVHRTYSARVIKTEYLKEMAARVVLAEAARSAGKYNKGISVLYVVSLEDFLLIAVRVHRGQKAVDSSLDQVAQLLHCRICEERTFLPSQLAPIDDPYSHLSCECKSSKTGKTAVILGPMWKGSIFNTEFLDHLNEQGKKLKLSAKFLETASLLLSESRCSSTMETPVAVGGKQSDSSGTRNHQNGSKGLLCETSERQDTAPSEPNPPKAEPCPQKSPHTDSHQSIICEISCEEVSYEVLHRKRKLSQEEAEPTAGGDVQGKKARLSSVEATHSENVPFYHNIRKFKQTIIHKLNKLVSILHSRGFRACRTHFDPCAIRTSANVQQFLKILE